MTDGETQRPTGRSWQVDESPEYQSLSVLAVVALVLAVISTGVFVSPLFLTVTAAAVGAAIASLAAIRKSEGALAGARLALAGLSLAIGCAVGAFTREAVRDSFLQDQASSAARQWLEAIAASRFDDARSMLTQDAMASLLPDPNSLPAPLSFEEAEQLVLDHLQADPLATAIAEQPAPIIEQTSAPMFDRGRTIVAVRFVAGGLQGSHRHGEIEAVRGRVPASEAPAWRINRWNLGDPHGAH